ncbi:MAG: peptidoglycan-binding protein [Actinomycetota bacterium]|nr:peptidoglycan-binding protein [Actinomycetota bacterium]
MRSRPRRTAATLLSAAVLAGTGFVPAGAALQTPVPFPDRPRGLTAPVAQPAEAEEYSGFLEQVSCNPVLQRGVRRLRNLALDSYGRGYDGGITRSCVSGGPSEHKEGRAWDWMLDAGNRAHRAAAGDFLAWLTRNGGLQARRLGVMYVIYNRKIWSAYSADEGWRAYSGYSPHTDHIHLSLSWAGARGRTSFWTGRVARTDYGPCVVFRGQMARLTDRANPRPCPSPVAAVRRSRRESARFGAQDSLAVRRAQQRLGIAATGDFDRTTWAAVKGYQRAHDLPVTGVLDNPTWASLAPGSVTWSVTEGYRPRQAARYARTSLDGPVVRRGSAGAPVAFLQKALGLPAADHNGLLARRTAAAVRAFKAEHGLVRNAVVNGAVWDLLAGR